MDWPGLSQLRDDFKIMIEKCEKCQALRQSNAAEEICAPRKSSRPMQFVGADVFQVDRRHYLVMVNHFLGCPFISQLSSISTNGIIRKINAWSRVFGYLETIRE